MIAGKHPGNSMLPVALAVLPGAGVFSGQAMAAGEPDSDGDRLSDRREHCGAPVRKVRIPMEMACLMARKSIFTALMLSVQIPTKTDCATVRISMVCQTHSGRGA